MNLIENVILAVFIALILLLLWREMRIVKATRRPFLRIQGAETSPELVATRPRQRFHQRLLGLLFLSIAVANVSNYNWLEHIVADPFRRLAWIGTAFVSVIAAAWMALKEARDIAQEAELEAMRELEKSLLRIRENFEQEKGSDRFPPPSGNDPPPTTQKKPRKQGRGTRRGARR